MISDEEYFSEEFDAGQLEIWVSVILLIACGVVTLYIL